jgi:hypothetical protein
VEKFVQFIHFEQSVVVHGVPIFNDLALPTPVPQSISAHPEVLRRFADSHELV